MRTRHVAFMAALPLALLAAACAGRSTTNPREVSRDVPAERYSTAHHEGTMTEEMNLNRPGKVSRGEASRQDNEALREQMAEIPHRATSSQAADGSVNEMGTGKDLPRPAGDGMSTPQQQSRQPSAIVEERTVVIVPGEPGDETAMRRDRGSEDIALRQGDQTARVGDAMEYEPEFRRNYESNFANSGYAYDQYRPAYYYGYELANDPQYRSIDNWSDIESQARRDWNESQMGPWERYREAVRFAWERVRQGRG